MAIAVEKQGAAGVRQAAYGGLLRHSDMAVAVMSVVVVAMMIIPLPPMVLDLLLTINIAGSLMILLVCLYSMEPLEFASFPTLVLLATLFRLALNISSTRLILLHGYAGEVIASFGEFVVGGNYIVGLVIFLLLVVIQFVVITQGAGRVAEVAARFTLDAMPGKQMAIDADLNAGLISEEGARTRRAKIQQEADFYGAMDGASKFVRGDAIAAIVMILVNTLGGFAVGMFQMKMDLLQALRTFTLLTVGDGLVCQIPALLLSTATGVIVTRAASESRLGHQVVSQTLSQPRAVMIASGMMLALAVVPGLPKLPFLVIAAALFIIARALGTETREAPAESPGEMVGAPAPAETATSEAPDDIERVLHVDPVEVEIGYGLIRLADPQQGGHLLSRVGLIVPPVRVRDNAQLRHNSYSIKLRGIEIGRSELYPRHHLAMDPGGVASPVQGIQAKEPAFGLPALWVDEPTRQAAELAGYTVVDPLTVLITHLTEMIRRHADELLSRQTVQELLDGVREREPAAVQGLVPDLLSLADVQRVLQRLLHERVSIRDLVPILEALGDAARFTKSIDLLTEEARRALARWLCQTYQAADGKIHVVMLDPRTEQFLTDRIRSSDQGSHLLLDSSETDKLLQQLQAEVEKLGTLGHPPVVLCSPRIRPHLFVLAERFIPNLVVLSYAELVPEAQVQSRGVVRIDQ